MSETVAAVEHDHFTLFVQEDGSLLLVTPRFYQDDDGAHQWEVVETDLTVITQENWPMIRDAIDTLIEHTL